MVIGRDTILLLNYERGTVMTFYDSHGKPIVYSDNGEDIYTFRGRPVAYFSDNKVYGFNGHYLGWFENGWIRDKSGRCVFFTENATGSGPIKPVKSVRPVKSAKSVKPVKSIKQGTSAKAANSSSWSQLSGVQFFEQ